MHSFDLCFSIQKIIKMVNVQDDNYINIFHIYTTTIELIKSNFGILKISSKP